MTSQSEAQIEDLARAACSHPASERAAFLDEACKGDPELRNSVERLASARLAPSEPAITSADDTDAPTLVTGGDVAREAPAPGRIKSYRIVGVLGEGGMGVVYRAEQDNPHRAVALKVLKAGDASAEALRRFEHEADVLGRLQHPGIAQIFEAGAADTGYGRQPFFAMELIDGVPLKKYVEKVKLSIRERLALLVKICEAVQHAHQKGVIHRDLKPSNILVDERGQPKILDFGIAVLTGTDIQTATVPTDLKQLAGTVPYMSLEQAQGNLNELDTRTDVYALGVIAYQLLSDRLPFDLEHKTIPEAAHIISEQRPRPLASIDKALRGDIEAIVSKAIEGDKRHRYQSASDLAADIRRHLADEPVLARPSTLAYQFSKFAKRNKVLVGSAVFLILMFLTAFVSTEHARKDADREANKAIAANEFLDSILSSADPTRLNKDVTVKQALDAAAKRLEGGSLADQPEVEATVRVTLGRTYRNLGFADTAKPHLITAMDINRRVLGERHRQTLTSMNELALTLKIQGSLTDAEALYAKTLAAQRRYLGGDHSDTLETMHNSAGLLIEMGRLSEAEPLLRQAYETQFRQLGENDKDTLIAANSLAFLLKECGKLDEAEIIYRRTLDLQRDVLGKEHPHTLVTMSNLAWLLTDNRNVDEAELLYRQVFEARQRVLDPDHPWILTSMSSLAALLQRQGKMAEAEDLYREAVRSFRRKLGDPHPRTITSIVGLASLLDRIGNRVEAEVLYREALELQRKVLPEGHPDVAGVMIRLGILLFKKGDAASAEPLLRECLSIRRKVLPQGGWLIANTESVLGECLTKLGRFREAEPLLVRSYPVIKAGSKWVEHKERALKRIIGLYEAWDKPEEADEYRAMLSAPSSK